MFAFDVIEEILLRSDAKDLVPWKRAAKGEGQHSQAMVKRTIVEPSQREEREIEELYRHEVGDTDNLYLHEDEIREIRSDVTMREERRRRWLDKLRERRLIRSAQICRCLSSFHIGSAYGKAVAVGYRVL
nr:hypothetical protein [Tanacetum cinerariifolium]